MKQIFVKQLFIYPIKGLTPQVQESVFLKVAHGIQGDRAFALMYRQDELNMHTEVPWMRKHHFVMY
ncbi:MAG: MOSC N-terminal beta barrel domain-containing protein [Calothrix sp. C42_A2020_038]|nr:MOSC N-terminal beta barrel domain-containing protein [Calothrix sp. C42_A2020_038]